MTGRALALSAALLSGCYAVDRSVARCDTDAECPDGTECVIAPTPTYGVCLTRCLSDADCPTGACIARYCSSPSWAMAGGACLTVCEGELECIERIDRSESFGTCAPVECERPCISCRPDDCPEVAFCDPWDGPPCPDGSVCDRYRCVDADWAADCTRLGGTTDCPLGTFCAEGGTCRTPEENACRPACRSGERCLYEACVIAG